MYELNIYGIEEAGSEEPAFFAVFYGCRRIK